MVFGTPEVVVILVLALVLFGPQKLPELARAIGQAVGEYNKAKGEFEREMRKASDDVTKEVSDVTKVEAPKESREGSPKVHKIAKNLGISVEGKDEATLLKEIDSRVSRGPTKRSPGIKRRTVSPRSSSPKASIKPRPSIKKKPEVVKRGKSSKASPRSK